jgi:hypothetical protein
LITKEKKDIDNFTLKRNKYRCGVRKNPICDK